MAGSNGTGISHYAWTQGLAAVVEGQARRTAAVFGPAGWEQGEASSVLPAGTPPGAEAIHVALPPWLAEGLAGLPVSAGGLHTEFTRLDRLLERLRAEQDEAVVLVLGEAPAVFAVAGGQVTPALVPSGSPGTASGWIVILSGAVPAPPSTPAEPTPAPAAPSEPRLPSGETFFCPPNGGAPLPEAVAAQVGAVAGPAGLVVPDLLDGSRTVAQIAEASGLTITQAAAVVRILLAHRLAFRYLRRAREV